MSTDIQKEFNIVLIKPNNLNIENISSITKEKINEIINEYTELITVTHDTMMENIIKLINLNTEIIGSTDLCYQNSNYIYQLCHIDYKSNKIDHENIKQNELGSILTIENNDILGNAVLIKSKIGNNYLCETSSMDKDLLYDLIYNRIFHKGIIVKTNGEIDEFEFNKNPFENLDVDISNYRYIELQFLKFDFILFIQLDPKPNEINKKITRIAGTYKVHGDVIMISQATINNFLNIDKILFDKIDEISWGNLSDRKLTEEENKDGEHINNLPIVMNRYCVLEKRLKENINKFQNKKLICTGCYRTKYSNATEQAKDWQYHKNNCLFDKNPINKYLKENEKNN